MQKFQTSPKTLFSVIKKALQSFTEYAQNLNQDIKTKKKSKFHLKINVSLKLWGNTEQNDVM